MVRQSGKNLEIDTLRTPHYEDGVSSKVSKQGIHATQDTVIEEVGFLLKRLGEFDNQLQNFPDPEHLKEEREGDRDPEEPVTNRLDSIDQEFLEMDLVFEETDRVFTSPPTVEVILNDARGVRDFLDREIRKKRHRFLLPVPEDDQGQDLVMIREANPGPAEASPKPGREVLKIVGEHESSCDIGHIAFLPACGAHLAAGFTGIEPDDKGALLG